MLDKQNKININIINEAICAFAFDDVETFGLQDVSIMNNFFICLVSTIQIYNFTIYIQNTCKRVASNAGKTEQTGK